jgi:ribosomal protein L40E
MFPDMNPAVVRRAPYPVQANHKRCAKCGKLLSRAAFECRRCGKRQRLRPRTIWLGMGAGLVVAMFGVATVSALSAPAHPGDAASPAALARPGTAEQPAPGSPRAGTAAGARLTAADLWLEYARDPAGADRRFRDRPVVVSGTVRSIERDFDGRLMIRLSTGGGIDTVNAKLAMRDDPAIAMVGKGRALSLGCIGRGALIGAPLLGSCSVL